MDFKQLHSIFSASEKLTSNIRGLFQTFLAEDARQYWCLLFSVERCGCKNIATLYLSHAHQPNIDLSSRSNVKPVEFRA
jgi:hypothetical protein